MRSDIAVGATFPDYQLPDHTDTACKLSLLQGHDPMVLTLHRGFYCPKDPPRDCGAPDLADASIALGGQPRAPRTGARAPRYSPHALPGWPGCIPLSPRVRASGHAD